MNLNLVVIRSADLDRSARFFAAVGVRLAPERHGTGPKHLAGQAGGAVLEVYPSGDTGSTAGVRLGFRVPSLAGVLASLAEVEAVVVVSPPKKSPWGLRAVVTDPDGHRVELVEGSGRD